MAQATSLLSRVFSPRVFARAIRAFDRATVVIVASTWGGVILLMLFALYTLNLSAHAKRQAVEAAAMEPSLPQMITRTPDVAEMGGVVDRLQKRFPDVSFSVGPDRSLSVAANDGSKFRMWLTSLSYIDTAYPKISWRIKDLCVGAKCSASLPMKAVLIPEKITFSGASGKGG